MELENHPILSDKFELDSGGLITNLKGDLRSRMEMAKTHSEKDFLVGIQCSS